MKKRCICLLLSTFVLFSCSNNKKTDTDVLWKDDALVIEIFKNVGNEIYSSETSYSFEYIEHKLIGIDVRFKSNPSEEYSIKSYRNVSYSITFK